MIQILLCDDDPRFLESLRNQIRGILEESQTPASLFAYQDAREIPARILKTADIFFLDIDFSGQKYNGLDIARKIREYSRNSILIFVTSYVEYAPEGYEMQAFRYLLKNELDAKLRDYLNQAIRKMQETRQQITVTIGGEPTTLLLSDILYLEAQGHSIKIHTPAGEMTVYGTMAEWEEKLSPLGFLRTQKSYLVNMQQIQTYQCDRLVLKNQVQLPVSEKFYREQKNKFLLWKGRQ